MLSVDFRNGTGEKTINVEHFTDGTLKMKCLRPSNLFNQPITITWKYEREEELVALIHLTLHLREAGANCIYLDLPYLPNARQDRVQNNEDVFTLKSFAQTINWLNFQRVFVRDAHSRVSVALLDRVSNEVPNDFISVAAFCAKRHFGCNNITIFYPDEGAMKRYSDTHEYPRTFGMKTRNPETNRVDSLNIAGDADHIKDSYVLIVDDICSKGDTALRSAKELLKAGAKGVALYVTHCENTVLENEELLETVGCVYTTDSIFTEKHPKIHLLT